MDTLSLRIAMVSYLNTIPFLKGLDSNHDLTLDVPSKCLRYFSEGNVDVALVPVGALKDIDPKTYSIVTDYCIGCDGAVRTVGVFSHVPIEDVTTIVLDSDSRTSVELTKIIAREYWKREVSFVRDVPESSTTYARLMIGDKVFEHEGCFPFFYDLGAVWKEHSGLPFVFAVWIANPSLGADQLSSLNRQLSKGVSNISSFDLSSYGLESEELMEYLTHYIKYDFGEEQRRSMKLFRALM